MQGPHLQAGFGAPRGGQAHSGPLAMAPPRTTPCAPGAPRGERGIFRPARAQGGESTGRQHPPEAVADSGRGGRERRPRRGAQEVRSREQPDSGGGGPGRRGERAESAAPGSQRSTHSPGWRAAAGARAQLAVFRGRNIHGAQRVLPPRRCPSQPRPPRGGERRPAGGGGSREGRAAPPPAEPPLPALSGGGSDGARWPRAGRPGSHAEEQSSLWQARHAPPPPLGGPALLFLLSPPLAPGDPRPAERGRGAADRDPGVPPPRPGRGVSSGSSPTRAPPRRPPLLAPAKRGGRGGTQTQK